MHSDIQVEANFAQDLVNRETLTLQDVLSFRYGGEYEQLLDAEVKTMLGHCKWLSQDTSHNSLIFYGSGNYPVVSAKSQDHCPLVPYC